MLRPKHKTCQEKASYPVRKKESWEIRHVFSLFEKRKVLSVFTRRFTHKEDALHRAVPSCLGASPTREDSEFRQPLWLSLFQIVHEIHNQKELAKNISGVDEAHTIWWLPAASLGFSQL